MHARIFAAGTATGLLLLSAGASSAPLTELRDAAEGAFHAGDTAALEATLPELAQLDGALPAYYRAYVHYRLAEMAPDDKKSAKQHLNDCIELLNPVHDAQPEFAAATALLGSCYGASAGYYRLRAMTRGIKAGGLMEAALEKGPDNPQVVLMDGVNDYNRPEKFGGDKDRALVKLRKAVTLFESAPPVEGAAPDWGHAEAWLYIARIEKLKGNTTAAAEAIGKARELAPGYKAAQMFSVD